MTARLHVEHWHGNVCVHLMCGVFACSSRVILWFAGRVCCRGARALLHALQVRNAGVAFVFFSAQRPELLTLLLSSV